MFKIENYLYTYKSNVNYCYEILYLTVPKSDFFLNYKILYYVYLNLSIYDVVYFSKVYKPLFKIIYLGAN